MGPTVPYTAFGAVGAPTTMGAMETWAWGRPGITGISPLSVGNTLTKLSGTRDNPVVR